MDEVFRINEPDAELMATSRDEVLTNLHAHLPDARIEEVGSTAVEGVLGKGDLDFLVLVSEADFGSAREILDTLYPRNAEQLSNDSYQGYLVPSSLDVAIQLTIKGTQYDTFLSFLDLLRRDANLRDAYNTLKRTYDGKPMSEYRAAKSQFIEAALTASAQNST